MSKLNRNLLTEIRRLVRARALETRDYAAKAKRAEALAAVITNLGFRVVRSQSRSPNGILWTVQVTHATSEKRGVGIRKSEVEAIQVAAQSAGAQID